MYISLSVIVFYILFLILGLYKSVKPVRYYRYMAMITTVAIAVWGYHFYPGTGLDLYRLRRYAGTFSGKPFSYVFVGDGLFNGYFLFNCLCYLSAKFDNPQLISTVSILVTFGLIGWYTTKYAEKENLTSRCVVVAIVLSFMGLQIQYVFSGVRNAMAVAGAASVVYHAMIKRKAGIFSVILFTAFCTMHPAILMLLPALFVATRKRQIIFRIAALATMPVVFVAGEVLAKVPVSFLQAIGNRILFYKIAQYQYDRPEMIANIFVFIAIACLYYTFYNPQNGYTMSALEKKYANGYLFLGCMMIGCAVHRDFTLRIGYMMGIGVLPMIGIVSKSLKKRGGVKDFREKLILIGLSILIGICCGKVYYDTFLAFASWAQMRCFRF